MKIVEPKFKAQQLVNLFIPNVFCYLGSGMLTNTYDEDTALYFAKRCAKISIKELKFTFYDNKEISNYCDEVTKEIDNCIWQDTTDEKSIK